MKLCYCDESGTGDEPIAVMVGIIVDAQRMHVTKEHWQDLLTSLSRVVGHKVDEIHTRDFYAGNGFWREIRGWLFRSLSSACVHAAFSSIPCESALSSRASESTKRQ